MGLFGFGRKKEIIDLSERYHEQQEKSSRLNKNIQPFSEPNSSGAPNEKFAIFGDIKTPVSSQTDFAPEDSIEERRKRLARRLKEMTEKIENLSNQIYHLQQRIEVLEKKMNITGGF